MALNSAGGGQQRAVVPPAHRQFIVLSLLIITAFGAALRLRGLGFDSLWFDEAVTWLQTRNGVLDAIVQTSRDTYPPGYNVATAVAVSLFGEAEWVLRLPAAIFGTLAIPALYWLGCLAAGRTAGFVAALLMALSTFALYYSQEARMYSLLMLAACLATASTISYVARPSLRWGVGIALAGGLLFYSQPYGALSWLSLAGMSFVVLLANRAGLRAILGCVAAFGAALLMFSPWLVVTLGVARDLTANGFWIQRPGWLTAFAGLAQISGSWLQFVFVIAGLLLSLLYWLPRNAPAGRLFGDVVSVPRSVAAPLLLASTFGPWLAGLVISLTIMPVFVPRYLICCLPGLLVLTAIGYAQLAERGRYGLVVVSLLLTVWLVPAAADDQSSRNGQNARALAMSLDYEMADGDCLLVIERHQTATLRYYLERYPTCDLTAVDDAELAAAIPAGAKLFLADYGTRDGMARITGLLGGTWSEVRRYGSSISLVVRDAQP